MLQNHRLKSFAYLLYKKYYKKIFAVKRFLLCCLLCKNISRVKEISDFSNIFKFSHPGCIPCQLYAEGPPGHLFRYAKNIKAVELVKL